MLTHDASTKRELGKVRVGRIDIGDNVFIGYQSIILPNVKIGNKVIIGAGCVVAKDIPDNSVVVGNPCRIISSYDDYILKNKNLMDTNPVYNQYVKDRSLEDNLKIRDELENQIGFDI